jgi:putative SOS response-associated peptidase YedK
MCGRRALHLSSKRSARIFDTGLGPKVKDEEVAPSWSVRPSREILGVAENREHDRVLELFGWGLVPHDVSSKPRILLGVARQARLAYEAGAAGAVDP